MRNRYSWILLTLAFVPATAFGQWSDDFSDGDLTTGTTWVGNTGDFTVNPALQLQLMAPQAGQSALMALVPVPDSAVWSFWIHLDFSPSTSNALRLVLQADDPDPSLANGYMLEIGETGNQDAVRLFRLDSGTPVLLASGTPGMAGGSSVLIRGQLTRSSFGTWTFSADYTGGTGLVEEFTVTDPTYGGSSAAWFGPNCTYTSTRTDKFYFDDFRIEPWLPDTEPPALAGIDILDDQEIRVRFSEPVDGILAADPERYTLEPGLGHPALASWNAAEPDEVDLVWTGSMAVPLIYHLEITGLTDTAGNLVDTLRGSFPFLLARAPLPGEVVINEILADPTPAVGLPEAEFLELWNRSSEYLNLGGLVLSTSSAMTTLPPLLLEPGGFRILTRPADTLLFAGYPGVAGIPGFPALPNDGTTLRLANEAGEILHEVRYLDDWHDSSIKRDGGWSLEMVDPDRRCDLTGNWRSCQYPSGGTPGSLNSVHSSQPDKEGPQLASVWPESPTTLVLTFRELVQPDPSLLQCSLDPARMIASVQSSGSGEAWQVNLQEALEPGTVYQVSVRSGSLDCLGNPSPTDQTLPVGLPEKAVAGDLIVNEILFDPPTGGSDFVELVNRSDKVLSLDDLMIGNIVPGKEEVRPTTVKALCFPGQHVVLTPDSAFIRQMWPGADPMLIFQTTTPAWANDSGNVTVFFADGPDLEILDALDYQEGMHHPLLNDTEGVSLERVSPDQPSALKDNWQSAAEDAGFGTPTARNSQYRDLVSHSGDGFFLEPSTFSPDGDGYQDVLLIRYALETSGEILNLRVFDQHGRLVRILANTAYLGREGLLAWHGDTEDGGQAGPGIYVLGFERYGLDGRTERFNRAAVLRLRMD